jgi:hypothetical protein
MSAVSLRRQRARRAGRFDAARLNGATALLLGRVGWRLYRGGSRRSAGRQSAAGSWRWRRR